MENNEVKCFVCGETMYDPKEGQLLDDFRNMDRDDLFTGNEVSFTYKWRIDAEDDQTAKDCCMYIIGACRDCCMTVRYMPIHNDAFNPIGYLFAVDDLYDSVIAAEERKNMTRCEMIKSTLYMRGFQLRTIRQDVERLFPTVKFSLPRVCGHESDEEVIEEA